MVELREPTGDLMSMNSYQSNVTRLSREQADAQKKIATAQGKVGKLRSEIATLRRDATRTTSQSLQTSKEKRAESKDKDLARAERQLADAYARKSQIDERLGRALDQVRRAEASAKRQDDAQVRRRRDEELRHYREITRETERQFRLQSAMPRGHLTIEFASLPERITVLFFAADPRDLDRLGLDEEIRLIQEKLRASEYRDAVELKSRWAVRPTDLLQALNEEMPHIVHFSGHGSEDEIAFMDPEGNTKTLTKEAIAQLMNTMTDNIRVVVFNSCYSSEQAAAVTKYVDVAIGMSAAIEDEAARTFSAQFYSAIGFGRSVRQAFDQARMALQLEGVPDADAPELFAREGIDPDEVVLVRP